MNKITFLLISFTFIILTTLVIDSLQISTGNGGVEATPTDIDHSISSIWSVIETFLSLVTFQLEGIPTFFNLIFSVIAIGIVYVIVDIGKDLIPLT